jgi:hypothetical protein
MRRAVRIALKAGGIYAAVSLVVAILMARIAAMYAPCGAELQAVAIHAADRTARLVQCART